MIFCFLHDNLFHETT